MFDIDILKSLTVRVNGGSGVLIRPLSPDILYVFTAYHCIKEHMGDIEINIGYGTNKGASLKICDKHYDEPSDAAIIIVERCIENVPFIGLREQCGEYSVDYPHLGYPKCREHTDDSGRDIAVRSVSHLLGKYDQQFEEYEYEKNITKDELEGMSGGGIFDDNYHLLGIHKQSKEKDENELLGSALYIPSRHYKKLISDNGLPKVVEFDLSTFEGIKDDVFDLSHKKGAKNKTEGLLTSLAVKLATIVDMSPAVLYNAFNNSRTGCVPVPYENLLKHDWASFGEFVLVTSIMMNADVRKELDKIISEFQYVYSDKDFDLEDVANELNPKIIGFMKPYSNIVIGGIRESGFPNDVMSYKKIPDLSNALLVNGFDVAKSPRQLLQAFKYVNVSLYKDAIMERCNEIQECDGDKLEFYISIIRKAIYGAKG